MILLVWCTHTHKHCYHWLPLLHPDMWYVCLGEKEGWLPVAILVPINEKLVDQGNPHCTPSATSVCYCPFRWFKC